MENESLIIKKKVEFISKNIHFFSTDDLKEALFQIRNISKILTEKMETFKTNYEICKSFQSLLITSNLTSVEILKNLNKRNIIFVGNEFITKGIL